MTFAPTSPAEDPTTAGLLRAATDALVQVGADTARLDAEVLLAAAWQSDRTQLYIRGEAPVPPAVAAAFHTMLQRRLAREPVAYILGSREFWSLDFFVGPGVLVPRPETELLVERAVTLMKEMQRDDPFAQHRAPRLCDIGTGSGCVAIALATELRDAALCATDVSVDALDVARANARRHRVDERITWLHTDLGNGLAPSAFDLVVSNPPYVESTQLDGLEPELGFEPRLALDGGADGLDVVRRLIAGAAVMLRPNGWLAFEFGAGQADAVRAAFAPILWSDVTIYPDLSGIPRVVQARRTGPTS